MPQRPASRRFADEAHRQNQAVLRLLLLIMIIMILLLLLLIIITLAYSAIGRIKRCSAKQKAQERDVETRTECACVYAVI